MPGPKQIAQWNCYCFNCNKLAAEKNRGDSRGGAVGAVEEERENKLRTGSPALWLWLARSLLQLGGLQSPDTTTIPSTDLALTLACWSRVSIRFGLRSSSLLFFSSSVGFDSPILQWPPTATFLLGIRSRVLVCECVCVGVNVKRNFCTQFSYEKSIAILVKSKANVHFEPLPQDLTGIWRNFSVLQW